MSLKSESNLAVAALRALGDLPPVRMELRKRIPVQAGLGGGSSDAAAVLRAAMRGTFGAPGERDWMADRARARVRRSFLPRAAPPR